MPSRKQPNLGHFSDNKMKHQINSPAYFIEIKTELDIAVTSNQRAHEYESVINYARNPTNNHNAKTPEGRQMYKLK